MGNFNCQKKTGKHMNDGVNPKNMDKLYIFKDCNGEISVKIQLLYETR